MTAGGTGISGLGLATATAGGFLLYTAILNVPVLEGLRQALRGRKPVPGPQGRAAFRNP